MAGFLDSLREFTTLLRGDFAQGNKPLLEPDVAKELSTLHMTFSGLMEGIPHVQKKAFRERFTDSVVRFEKLQELMAGEVSTLTGISSSDLMADNRSSLFDEATKAGLLQESAAEKNRLYRFTPKGRKTIERVLNANSSVLGIGGDEVGSYSHFVSGLNMNLAPATGQVSIAPNALPTAETHEKMRRAYSRRYFEDADNVWNVNRGEMGRPFRPLVFDLETSGGPASTANVNEVAARRINLGAAAPMGFGDEMRETFSVGRMTLGTYGKGTEAQTLNIKFRNGTDALFTRTAGDGAAYVEKIRPILAEMAEAPAILGQNIMGFDIDQLVGNVMRTSEYMNGAPDDELHQIVGKIRGRINDEPGYVIDTMKMLSGYEDYKGVALGRSPLMPNGATTRSLQNVLLNTNLIQFMQNNLGDGTNESLWDIATKGGGHHTGSFDTTVTAAYYKAMVSDELELNVVPDIGAGKGQVSLGQIKEIVSSGAYTPMTKISNPDDILDDTWRTMYQKGLETDGKALRLIPVDPRDKSLSPIIPGQDHARSWQEMRDFVIDSDRYRLDMDATYLQQTSIFTRSLDGASAIAESTDDVYRIVGQSGDAWELMTRLSAPYAGTLNQDGSIFKRGVGFSLDEFTEYQKSIAGLPFADIGLPERNITMAAVYGSQTKESIKAASAVYSGAESVMDLAPDMGISFWGADKKLFGEGAKTIVGSSNTANTTLGMTVDTARQLNRLAGTNLFDVDLADDAMPFLEVNAGRYDDKAFVNLQMNMLDEVDVLPENRAALMGELKDMNIDPAVRERVIGRIRGEKGNPIKITLGSQVDEAAEATIEALEMGSYNLQSGPTVRMQMLDYASESIDGGPARGVLQMGPAIIGDTHTRKELGVLRSQGAKARTLFRDMGEMVGSNEHKRAVSSKNRANRKKRGVQKISDLFDEDIGGIQYDVAKRKIGEKVNKGFDTIAEMIEKTGLVGERSISRSMLKKATIPGLILGTFGAFAARKSDEEELYEETFEQGPTNPNGYYSSGMSSADPIHKRVRPRISPLATANLVFDSYDNRTGHTRPPGR